MGILGNAAITRLAPVPSAAGCRYSGRMYFFTYNSPCWYFNISVISSPTQGHPVTSCVGVKIISSLRRWAGNGLRPGWFTRTTVCFTSCAFTCFILSTTTSPSLSFSNKAVCSSLLLATGLNFSCLPLKINFCNSRSCKRSKLLSCFSSSITLCCVEL